MMGAAILLFLEKWLVQKGGKALMALLSQAWAKINRAHRQKLAKKKYEEVAAKPDATAAEVGQAYADFINSR